MTALVSAAVLIVKTCGCGRPFTVDAWLALPLHGWVGVCWRGGLPIAAEMRTCPCGSTLAVECVAPKKTKAANAQLAEVAR